MTQNQACSERASSSVSSMEPPFRKASTFQRRTVIARNGLSPTEMGKEQEMPVSDCFAGKGGFHYSQSQFSPKLSAFSKSVYVHYYFFFLG